MSTIPPKLIQIIALSLILLVSGCAQRDSGVGINAITGVPEQDFITISGTATASAEWIPELSNGRGNSLQVGDASDFRSFSVLRWDPAAALPDSYVVESVRIKLTTGRIWPSTSDSTIYVPDLRMIVREIPVEWDEDDLIPGTLADFESFEILDTILIDSDPDDSVFYDLPFELWQKWVDESLAQDAEDTVSTLTSYGLLFEPANEGVLVEFLSSEGGSLGDDETGSTAPVLRMEGTRWDLDDTVYVSSALFLEQLPDHDGYLTSSSAEPQPGRMIVSAGYPQRELVYFPLDSLAEFTERLIARAEFRVFADPDDPLTMVYPNTGLNFKTGSLTNSDWVNEPDSVASVTLRFVGTDAVALDADAVLLKFDVTGIVSGWMADPAANGGLQIQTSGENQFLSRQIFHNHETEDESKRPQLFIWYVEPSN
ncbi:DNRLRE domain-containing protein [bacterium]|nr:DNRLRE domain-containing protein [bacterium]